MAVELKSFSRAAERLGIAQPVVSAHIKALSDKLGSTLTVRNGRSIALTEDGERVYRWAREIVSRTREIEREMSESQKGTVGRATVGASMTVGSYILPGMISAFHRNHPKGDISVRITTPMLATDAIHNGDCDFTFTILDPRHDTEGLETEHIANDRLILMSSEKTGLDRQTLRPEELCDHAFVTAQLGTPRREIEEALLRRFGVRRQKIEMEFGHAEAIKQAVRAGAGLAFLFQSSVSDEIKSGVLREIETPGMVLDVPVYLVRRRKKTLSSFQIALMEFLTNSLEASLGAPAMRDVTA